MLPNKTARFMNVVLGVWLLLSAFGWRHGAAQFTISIVTGIAIVAVALMAMASPRFRFLNIALGAWLFISAFAFRHSTAGTVWNSVFVAVLVFFVALISPAPAESARRPAHSAS
jgi:hypothetical protein